MDIIIADQAFFHSPHKWIRAILLDSSDAPYKLVQFDNGEVLSVLPDGTMTRRPSGTDAPYEQLKVVGNNLVSRHSTPSVIPFLYV